MQSIKVINTYAKNGREFKNMHPKGLTYYCASSTRIRNRTNDVNYMRVKKIYIYTKPLWGDKKNTHSLTKLSTVIVFTEPYDGDKDKPQVQSKR